MAKSEFVQSGDGNVQTNVTGKKARVKNVTKNTFVNPMQAEAAAGPTFSIKKSRPLPLTRRIFNVLSVAASIASIAGLGIGLWPFVSGAVAKSPMQVFPGGAVFTGSLIFLAAVLTLVLAAEGRKMIRLRRRHLFRFAILPAIAADGDHLSLETYVGQCNCGGALAFCNAPSVTHKEVTESGRIKTVVDKREFVAICERNSDHRFSVAPEV